MDEHCDLLFVYGTLLDEKNEFAAYLKGNSTFLQKGRFKGRLYDLGEYPGAVFRPANQEYVYGSIYMMNKPEKILKILDDYEGIGEIEEQPDLFVRELIEIETETQPAKCWVYFYNLPIDNLKQIVSGRYLQ